MPSNSPFTETGFMPAGQAYRLFTFGISPPTPLGAGRVSNVTLTITYGGVQALEGELGFSGELSTQKIGP